ncbi:MAG: hypothetical protein HY716_18050 [Planctomycetes bacterium]|nr:hypothetical protein [Planctomycetota bacterium]
MRWLTVFLGVAAAAGCGRPEYREPDPIPVEVPPPLPEKILRVPVDFTFKDFTTGRQYFYRLYSDAEISHDVITVLVPGAPYEVPATAEEREYAFRVLEEDWLRHGMNERLEFLRQRRQRELRRLDANLDLKIQFLQRAIAHVEEEILTLNADLEASTKTPGYQAPAGRLPFLTEQIGLKRAELAELTMKQEALRFLRAQRDREHVRSTKASAP